MTKINAEQASRVERLSDVALVLLSQAANRDDGMVLPPPASLRTRGGALQKVLTKLLRQDLVEEIAVKAPEQVRRTGDEGARFGLKITSEGLKALGVPALVEQHAPGSSGQEQRASSSGRRRSEPVSIDVPGVKPGSKQALLVELLLRPDGAKIADLVKRLGWQAHTVRAALTGLRQKGYGVIRFKNAEDETVYRASPPLGKTSATRNW